jgi:hypothetical protein
MGKHIIVENDQVVGTDKHNVTGDATNPAPPPDSVPASKWVAEFDYKGKMTSQLSTFVNINDKPLAVKTSQSSLNPGEAVAPTGAHSGPMGKNFLPPAPPPFPAKKLALQITDPVGVGKPSANAGSKMDTCDGLNTPMNATVTAQNQNFVACSA